MTKALYILALVCAWSLTVNGQDTLLVQLAQAKVISARPDRVFSENYPDSLQLLPAAGGSLADLLIQAGLWNLRQYGPQGTLVTGAEQGLLPDHTTVLWEGVPLNSPSLGLVDLSQIPLALFDNVSAQSQPIMSANPVQSIGPSIELNANSGVPQKLNAGLSFNNLQNLASWAQVHYRLKRAKLTTRAFHRTNRNNFTYTDPWKSGRPVLNAAHNDHALSAIMQRLNLPLWSKTYLEASAWLQGSRVNLPEQLGSYGQSFAVQTDSSMRFVAKMNGTLGKLDWEVKSAHFNEAQHFVDRSGENTQPLIDSRIRTTRWLLTSSFSRVFGNVKLVAQPLIQKDQAYSDYYLDNKAVQWQALACLQAVWLHPKWNIRGLIRHDFHGTSALPVVQLAAQRTGHNHTLELGVAHIFRRPDINELYWIPGGDAQLRPESGVKSYVRINIQEGNFRPQIRWEVFSHHMKEMIQWVPESGIYSAVNSGSVAVNGISLGLIKHWVWPIGRGQLFSHLKGEQYAVVPYYFPQGAPHWSARGNLGIRLTGNHLTWQTQVRSNINQWNPGIPAFVSNRFNVMHDAGVTYKTVYGVHEFRIQLTIQNIWNQMDWSAVYPLPGRVVSLQIVYVIKSTN